MTGPGHPFSADRSGRCRGCGLYRAQHAHAAKQAVADRRNENIARYGGTALAVQTDLWTLNHRGDTRESAWWALKDEALRAVTYERRDRGCDCEAPPWFSPPAEWPMKILLSHNPGCSTIRTPERETVISLDPEPSFPPYPAREAIETASRATGWSPSPPAIQPRAGREREAEGSVIEGLAGGGFIDAGVTVLVGEGTCTLTAADLRAQIQAVRDAPLRPRVDVVHPDHYELFVKGVKGDNPQEGQP